MLTVGGLKWHETLHYACTVSDAGSCVGVDRSLLGSFGPGSDEPPKTLTKIRASAVASSGARLKSRFVSGAAWNRTWWLPKAEVGKVGFAMVELPGSSPACRLDQADAYTHLRLLRCRQASSLDIYLPWTMHRTFSIIITRHSVMDGTVSERYATHNRFL